MILNVHVDYTTLYIEHINFGIQIYNVNQNIAKRKDGKKIILEQNLEFDFHQYFNKLPITSLQFFIVLLKMWRVFLRAYGDTNIKIMEVSPFCKN